MSENTKLPIEIISNSLATELSSANYAVQTQLTGYDYLSLVLFFALCVIYVCFKKGISIRDLTLSAKFIRSDLIKRYGSLRDANGRITAKSVITNLVESKKMLSAIRDDEISTQNLSEKFLTTFKIPKWYLRIFALSVAVCFYFLLADFFRF